MKSRSYFLFHFLVVFNLIAYSQNDNVKISKEPWKYNKLTTEEERVIVHKGTEIPGTGKYCKHKEKGVYVCKRCNAPLYRSSDKLDSCSGWPGFNDEIKGAVLRVPEAGAGGSIEIVCANCKSHLGHVFPVEEEGYTKNVHHCVNSVSLDFIPAELAIKTDTAIFASGCFWGTEYYLSKAKGVISAEAGYTGGSKDNPTYKEVCSGRTGHVEAVRVVFDSSKTTYEDLTKIFFETHDPTQKDGQGTDIGTQYRSAIFYFNDDQKKTAEKLSGILKEKGLHVATKITRAGKFWKAEDYHQDYCEKAKRTPSCHSYTKRF
jgi:peptide methionine sulfoxide reductase msrA/msrB